MIEFQAWPSIARINRDCVITEKIDGSNAAVVIKRLEDEEECPLNAVAEIKDEREAFDTYYAIAAQSRKRIITPEDDNFGFAKWVRDNARELFQTLGEGIHYGEWVGSGIQRSYGLKEKRLYLFNTPRWRNTDLSSVTGLYMVPELFIGEFSTEKVQEVKNELLETGSHIVKGFNPEGVVVFHTASRTAYKSTYEEFDEYGFNGGKSGNFN